MERSLKQVTTVQKQPETPKLPEIGVITFSWIKDLNQKYHKQDGELTEEVKNSLFKYARHKYYWEKKGKGISNQAKKTLQLLQDMKVFQ